MGGGLAGGREHGLTTGAGESTRYSGRVERVDLSGFHLPSWINRRGSRLSLAAVWPLAAVWLRAVADLKTCERVVPCACVKMCWMLTFLSRRDFRPKTVPWRRSGRPERRAPSWRVRIPHIASARILHTMHAHRPSPSAAAVKERHELDQHPKWKWGVDGNWSYSFGPFGVAGERSASSFLAQRDRPPVEEATYPASAVSSVPPVDILEALIMSKSPAESKHLCILDIGCGKGQWLASEALNCARRGHASAWRGVTGSDSSFRREGLPGVDVQVLPRVAMETAEAVDEAIASFGLGPFDVMVSSFTWLHLGDPLATLEIWANHLAEGGSIFINQFRVAFEGEFDAGHDVGDDNARWARALAMRDGLAHMDRAQGAERNYEIRFWAAMEADGQVFTALHLRRLSARPIRFRGVAYTGQAPPMDNLNQPASARMACTTYACVH